MTLRKWALALVGLVAGSAALMASWQRSPAAADPKVVRLATVNTPYFSGLIDALMADFQKSSGYTVTVYGGTDVYDRARAGEADIVLSHYGKKEVERFVLDGFGSWPQMVFSNQLVLVGPKSDPAGIRGMTSVSAAFAKIAASHAPYVENALPSIQYLTEVLWNIAGKPDKTGWFDASGEQKGRAMGYAQSRGAYVIWGALPFLRYKDKHATDLEVMVSADALLHRVMGTVLVNPDKVPGVNTEGAQALQKFLLSAETQAKIAAFRSPGSDDQFWWPAARDNNAEGLDE